jgi:hypothetical protein
MFINKCKIERDKGKALLPESLTWVKIILIISVLQNLFKIGSTHSEWFIAVLESYCVGLYQIW